MLAWARRRPVVVAALIYALLSLAFVSPGLVPGRTLSASDYLWSTTPWDSSRPDDIRAFGSNFDQLDAALQFQPGYEYTSGALPDVPLWNPHLMGGHTWVGNFQSAIFSPFTTPAYVLPLWDSLAWMAALKLFVAAFGTFLLGRALGMRFGGALLSGIVYAFGFWFVAWLAWPTASVWAWIPWLLLLTDHVVRRPGPLPVAGLAAVVGLQFFGGHPESSFHTVFAAAAFFVLRLVQERRAAPPDERPLGRPVAAFAIALGVGVLLAAVTILPFLESLFESGELTERTASNPEKVPAKFLLGIALPDFWGRPTEFPIVGFVNTHAFYAGALPLMLAAAALIFRPTLERVAIAGFGFVALATVTGIPPFHQIVNHLPVFTSVHNSRLAILYLLAVALLAGFGLDELTSARAPHPRARWVLWLSAALALAPAAWLAAGRPSLDDVRPALETAWGFASPPQDKVVIRLASLIVWVTFAGGAVALLYARTRRRLPAGAFAALAVALVVADLFRIGVGLNPSIPESHAEQPVTGSIRYLQDRRPRRFAGATFPTRFELLPLAPNLAMRYGLYDARGYDFPLEKRYEKLWEREVDDTEGIVPPTRLAPITDRSLRALSLLSVSDILTGPADPSLRQDGLRLAYEGSDAKVYANSRALPRAFVANSQRIVDGEDAALDAVTDPGFDGRHTAVVEEELPRLPQSPPPGRGGAARIVSYESDRVTIEAKGEQPGIVVLTDVHHPGWKATVDGIDADVERVDYLLRGVAVGAGTHAVELRYEPISWRLGWILSLAALIAILAVALTALIRGRRARSGAYS